MRIGFMVALIALSSFVPRPGGAETTLTVMSLDIWGGGADEKKPVDETVAALRAAKADIIGLKETRLEADPCTAVSCPPAGESVAKAIDAALGFHYYDQSKANDAPWANAIVGPYPIGGPLTLADFSGSGADWLGRFKPHIEDGKTIVVSPHEV